MSYEEVLRYEDLETLPDFQAFLDEKQVIDEIELELLNEQE